VVENPDGTFNIILKQKKITTITENIPVETDKIKLVEGVPSLPVYKQKITYNYETITSSQKKNYIKGNNTINKTQKENEIDNDGEINRNLNKEEEEFGEDRKSQRRNMDLNCLEKNEDENNIHDFDINKEKNINKNYVHNFDINRGNNLDENNIHNYDVNRENNLNKNRGSNLNKNKFQKGFKNKQEFEKYTYNSNRKEGTLTKEESEKRMNLIKNIFDAIDKGNNSENNEDNMEKLSILLANMNPKERKEMLEKLSKDNDNFILLKKLENLVEKKVNNRNTLESNKFKFSKGLSGTKNLYYSLKSQMPEDIEIKQVTPLKFDGLFLEISQYNNERKEKNPFDGPSPYNKFYRERSIKIKKKINNMTSGDSEQKIRLEEKFEE